MMIILFTLNVRAQVSVGRATGRDVALEEYEALPLQVRRAKFTLARERVVGSADEDEAVAAQRNDFEAATLFRIGDDAEVYGSAQNVAHDARRAAVFEVNLRLRVERHELAHDRRQLVKPDAVDGRHADSPPDRSRQLSHALFQLPVGRQHVAARMVERLARLRQVQLAPTAHAFKQSAFELRFEAPHLLADSRLGDEVALRRLREAARLDEVAEDFERFDLHRGYKTSSVSYPVFFI